MSKMITGEKLKDIAHATRTAEVVMTHLALRQRSRGITDLYKTKSLLMKAGEKIEKGDYHNLWKSLELAGAGKYTIGRGRNHDTFTWNVSLKVLAAAALNGQDVLVHPPLFVRQVPRPALRVAPPAPVPTAPTEEPRNPITTSWGLRVQLRPSFEMDVKLPEGFTQAEADAIYRSLKIAAK